MVDSTKIRLICSHLYFSSYWNKMARSLLSPSRLLSEKDRDRSVSMDVGKLSCSRWYEKVYLMISQGVLMGSESENLRRHVLTTTSTTHYLTNNLDQTDPTLSHSLNCLPAVKRKQGVESGNNNGHHYIRNSSTTGNQLFDARQTMSLKANRYLSNTFSNLSTLFHKYSIFQT